MHSRTNKLKHLCELRYGGIMTFIGIYPAHQNTAETNFRIIFIDKRQISQYPFIGYSRVPLVTLTVCILDIPQEEIDEWQRISDAIGIGIAAGLHSC